MQLGSLPDSYKKKIDAHLLIIIKNYFIFSKPENPTPFVNQAKGK